MEEPDSDDSDEYDYKKYIDKSIRMNREIFLLSLLMEGDFCGYDLIKKIFIKWDVLLSQGTVYPVLYSFEEEGVLHAEFARGDMRTKIYSLTPDGRTVAQKMVEDFIKAMEHIHSLIKR